MEMMTAEICSAVVIIAFLDLDKVVVETKIASLSSLQAKIRCFFRISTMATGNGNGDRQISQGNNK
jgi:hypothetical protein